MCSENQRKEQMKSRHLSQTYINATEEIVADGVKTCQQDVYEKNIDNPAIKNISMAFYKMVQTFKLN